MNPAFLGASRIIPASGDPLTWYDNEIVANANTDEFSSNASFFWTTITPSQGGSSTKGRIYQTTRFGDCTYRMALYNNAGSSLLASGSVLSTAGNQYWEIVWGTPYTVTPISYQLAWSCENANVIFRYKDSAGTVKISTSGGGYAAFPPSSLPSPDFTLSRNYVVSLWV